MNSQQLLRSVSSFKVLSLIALLACALSTTAVAQSHGGAIFNNPVGSTEVHTNDIATSEVIVYNFDGCNDSLLINKLVFCVGHASGGVCYTNTYSPPILLAQRLDFFMTTFSYPILPGDEFLPGGILTNNAEWFGTDNRDSILCPVGVPDDFLLTFPGQVHVLANTNTCICSNVLEAVSDSFNPGGSQHALWLPGISTNLIFSPNLGSWMEFPDGTATLTGTVHSRTNPSCGFIIDVHLSGRTTIPPSGSPKLDLDPEVYVPNGPVNPANFYYYPVWSGTLTGVGPCWEGAILDIVRTGPAFQVGPGANQKNIHFGASGWFNWTVRQQRFNGPPLPATGRGDFNIDILPCICNPAPCIACNLQYPFTSSNPRTKLVFNESEVLRAFNGGVLSLSDKIRVWYNDEHALALGVRRTIVKTSAGNTTTDHFVTPLSSNPGSELFPSVGATDLTGDQAGTDVSDRPLFPALFITDVTTDPLSLAGDWQFGGTPIPPHAVYGTWKAAVRTVDRRGSTPVVTLTMDNDPAQNHWNLGAGDPAPAGLNDEGYGAEVVWNISDLQFGGMPLQAGHSYRLQFMVHDGDQTKSGGDVGQNCVTVCIPPAMPAPIAVPLRVTGLQLMPASGVKLTITGMPGRIYLVEGSENLGQWRSVALALNNNGTLQFSDPGRTTRSFYRVKLLP